VSRLRDRLRLLAVHVGEEQRRAAGYWAWRALVLGLWTLVVGWDAVGLLAFGDDGYASPSFDVLRLIPGGMRTYGPALAALVVAGLVAYGRHRGGRGRSYVWLRLTLACVAVFYTAWCVAIVGAWWVHRQILSWGVGKLLFIAGAAVILGWMTPTMRPPGDRR
jgi:hypothetical protein